MKAWIDGELMDGERARVPVLDHGLLYGDGVFEGIAVIGGKAFQLEEHLARLKYGLSALNISLSPGLLGLRDAVAQTVEAHGAANAYVRLIVTRGEGPLGIDPTTCPAARVICIVDTLTVFSAEKRNAGLSLVTSSYRRPPNDVLDTRVKSLNYLNNVLAKGEARRQGVDDALMLNQSGHVAEATVANLFVVRDGVLITPPPTDGGLEGITRATVMKLAQQLGIEVRERSLGRFDVLASEECFLTGTGAGGLVRVASLDGQPVGRRGEPGPVTQRLAEAHQALC